MTEFIDEDFQEFPMMDPELFANMPANFAEYAARNPAILPDYRPFAYGMIDLMERRPGEHVVLHGPCGIGKTTLLAAALLETGIKRGYHTASSLTFHDGEFGLGAFFDSYDLFVNGVSGMPNFDMSSYSPFHSNSRRQEQVSERIRSRFVRAAGGLAVVDEIPGLTYTVPEFVKFLFNEARYHNVNMIFTVPSRPKDLEDLTWEEVRPVFTHATGAKLIDVTIPEQPVNLGQLPHIAETFGIEESFTRIFNEHPRLARLRVMSFIVDALAGRKSRAPDDDFIATTYDAKHLLQGIINAKSETDRAIFGLSVDEAKVLEKLLRPVED
jgi:hypothetical protein